MVHGLGARTCSMELSKGISNNSLISHVLLPLLSGFELQNGLPFNMSLWKKAFNMIYCGTTDVTDMSY